MKASEKIPPKHLTFTTKDELDKKALELSAQGFDVYFAVGSLKNRYVEVNGRRHVRVKENILALRSIFLDLDVDPDDPKKFQSPDEAISETRKFADLLNWQHLSSFVVVTDTTCIGRSQKTSHRSSIGS